MTKMKILMIGVAIATVASVITVAAINQQEAEAVVKVSSSMKRHFSVQTSQESGACAFGGHNDQIVMAVPPRTDGRMWKGTVTWTASKPIEVTVLHGYDPGKATGLEETGEPITATFADGTVALTMLKYGTGTAGSAGTLNFAGDALAFHNSDGEPFAVTYSVDALAKRVQRDACPYPNCQ